MFYSDEKHVLSTVGISAQGEGPNSFCGRGAFSLGKVTQIRPARKSGNAESDVLLRASREHGPPAARVTPVQASPKVPTKQHLNLFLAGR